MGEEEKELEFISLRNDLLFHMVFSKNEGALIALLSVLLNIPARQIKKVDILNPMQYSDAVDSKLTILDLKLHLDSGKYVIVEMQVRKFDYWTNRVLAYACRQVADQVTGDFDYSKLEPVIQISIMDYTLFPENRKFFDEYILRDNDGFIYTDMLKFLVMDLSAIGEASEEQKKQGLVEWAKAFRANSWNEVEEIDDSGVKEAAKTMKTILSNPRDRELIRMRRDAEIDRRTEINSAESRGRMQTAELMNYLWSNGRGEDAMKASQDEKYLKALLSDFNNGMLAAR